MVLDCLLFFEDLTLPRIGNIGHISQKTQHFADSLVLALCPSSPHLQHKVLLSCPMQTRAIRPHAQHLKQSVATTFQLLLQIIHSIFTYFPAMKKLTSCLRRDRICPLKLADVTPALMLLTSGQSLFCWFLLLYFKGAPKFYKYIDISSPPDRFNSVFWFLEIPRKIYTCST